MNSIVLKLFEFHAFARTCLQAIRNNDAVAYVLLKSMLRRQCFRGQCSMCMQCGACDNMPASSSCVLKRFVYLHAGTECRRLCGWSPVACALLVFVTALQHQQVSSQCSSCTMPPPPPPPAGPMCNPSPSCTPGLPLGRVTDTTMPQPDPTAPDVAFFRLTSMGSEEQFVSRPHELAAIVGAVPPYSMNATVAGWVECYGSSSGYLDMQQGVQVRGEAGTPESSEREQGAAI